MDCKSIGMDLVVWIVDLPLAVVTLRSKALITTAGRSHFFPFFLQDMKAFFLFFFLFERERKRKTLSFLVVSFLFHFPVDKLC